MYTSPEIEAAESLYRLHTELLAHTAVSGVGAEWGEGDFEAAFSDYDGLVERRKLVDAVIRNANHVVNSPGEERGHARFALTRLALEVAYDERKPLGIGSGIDSPTCLNAELGLGQSIFRIGRSYIDSRLMPPAVHFDVYGEPCAIQKEYGITRNVFVWRRALMASDEGIRSVPAGSFVRMRYTDGSADTRSWHGQSSEGLIELHGSVPESIKLIRFSMLMLNRVVARTALNDYVRYLSRPGKLPGEYLSSLQRQVSTMSRISPATVGAEVREYLTGEDTFGQRLLSDTIPPGVLRGRTKRLHEV